MTYPSGYRLQAVDFDKDVDAHMAVVAATSNLRAANYKIPEARFPPSFLLWCGWRKGDREGGRLCVIPPSKL